MKSQSLIAVVALALSAMSVFADNVVVTWTNSASAQLNWKTPLAWSNLTGPESNDLAIIGKTAGQVSNVKITDCVGPFQRFCIGSANYTTNHIEFAEGAVMTNTVWNSSLTLNVSKDGTAYDAWSLLKFTGGTFYFVVPKPDVGGTIRGAISVAGSGSCKGFAKMQMESGNVYLGYGLNVGNNSSTGEAEYLQTGGRVSIDGGNGFVVAKNAKFKMEAGDFVTPTSVNHAFDGPGEISGGTMQMGSFTVQNGATFTQSGGTVNTGKTVTSPWVRINDGAYKMTGGLLEIRNDTAGQIQLNSGMNAHSLFQLDGGVITSAYLNVANAVGGSCDYVQTGGVADFNTYLGCGQPQSTTPRVEVSGGTFTLYSYSYGFISINNGCTNSLTFCLRGTPEVTMARVQPSSSGSSTFTNRVHHLFLIDERGLAPLKILNDSNGAGSGPSGTLSVHHSAHPYGGFQVLTNDAFALFRGNAALTACETLEVGGCTIPIRRPDAALWHTGFTDGISRDWGVTLTNAAEIATGFTSAEGVAFGYFTVPPVRLVAGKAATAFLSLEAKGTNTVAGLVADIDAKSGCDAKEIAGGEYNVQIRIPLEKLGDETTNRKLLFDFTSEESPKAFERGEIVTNAVVKAFSFQMPLEGTVISVR